MKKAVLLIPALVFSIVMCAQTAPDHLKYFGFAIIDCLYDDPLDIDPTTNYIAEVDSFSNIAHMCIYDYADNIVDRVNLMNDHCVLPLISIQNIFYELVDSEAPSGDNFDLISNFTDRWNGFKTVNSAVLNNAKIGAFYIADEPFWNGLTFLDLDTVCTLIKADYPDIPIMLVEAYPALSNLQVPTGIDWLGFDRYGVFNPDIDSNYLADLALLKSKRSTPDQDIFLIIDDQWLPMYGAAGFSPDTIRFMVQNYYNLAAGAPEIIGMIGYLWPGGLDDAEQLGVRNMPQSVIDKNVEIGQMIKANFSPCTTTGIPEAPEIKQLVEVFPNPTSDIINFRFENNRNHLVELILFDPLARVVRCVNNTYSNTIQLDLTDEPGGLYFYRIKSNAEIIGRGKIIKQ